jgi:fucose permease
MVATTITGSVLGANVLLTRIGPRRTLPLGMLASAASMAWLTRLTVTSSYPAAVLGPLLILGLGLGLIFAPAISLGTARLRGQDTGVGSALVNTTQQVGGAVGIALLSTLAASATTSYLRPHAAITPALLQHAAVHGYTTAYWTATAIFTAGALLTALLYRPGRPDPADLVTVPA